TALPGGRLLAEKGRSIVGGLGFYARFLQETQVAKPVDEAVLPFAEGNPVAVGQAGSHPGTIAQRVARMATVTVDVHFYIWNPGLEHGSEVFVSPNGVDAVAGTGADNEGRRSIARDRWIRVSGKGCWARID